MIVAFYFRLGPTGGPHELVSVPPRRYAIHDSGAVEPERGDRVSDDLDPCAIEHACNLCDARTLEALADLQGDDWLGQLSRVQRDRQPLEAWWPMREVLALEQRHGRWSGAGGELVERVGHVELCPACYAHHGDIDDWPDELLDRVYGPETGPARFYPDEASSA